MERGPAIFTGAVFVLFGAGLVGWTAARLRHRRPVVLGAEPRLAAGLVTGVGIVALALGAWCLALL
ncbi:hypothetical protein AAH978_00045 [Streptomyces sp. ZYX-F-203]